MKKTIFFALIATIAPMFIGCSSDDDSSFSNREFVLSDQDRVPKGVDTRGYDEVISIGSIDYTADIRPIEVGFRITDENGNNLLDPNRTDFDFGKITVVANGEKQAVTDALLTEREKQLEAIEQIKSRGRTRTYGPVIWKGAYLWKDFYVNKTDYYVLVGEYDGEKAYHGEPVIIQWPNMQADTLSFDSEVQFTADGPNVTRRYYLNGERIKNALPSFIMK